MSSSPCLLPQALVRETELAKRNVKSARSSLLKSTFLGTWVTNSSYFCSTWSLVTTQVFRASCLCTIISLLLFLNVSSSKKKKVDFIIYNPMIYNIKWHHISWCNHKNQYCEESLEWCVCAHTHTGEQVFYHWIISPAITIEQVLLLLLLLSIKYYFEIDSHYVAWPSLEFAV